MIRNTPDEPLYSMEDAPLYALPDDPKPSDEFPTPLSEDEEEDYGEDDDTSLEENEEDTDTTQPVAVVVRRPSPLGIMVKTMLGPVEGWKSLKRARLKTDEFAARCFYPLIALAALSTASMFFYEAGVTMADWAKTGLSTFISFFFGYFTVLFAAGIILPKKARPILHKDIGKQFVMLAMSTLALFSAVIHLLPLLQPVLVFLPLWTIYIVFKGVRLLRVPAEVHNSTTGLLCMIIIGAPLLWNWLMGMILPLGE